MKKLTLVASVLACLPLVAAGCSSGDQVPTDDGLGGYANFVVGGAAGAFATGGAFQGASGGFGNGGFGVGSGGFGNGGFGVGSGGFGVAGFGSGGFGNGGVGGALPSGGVGGLGNGGLGGEAGSGGAVASGGSNSGGTSSGGTSSGGAVASGGSSSGGAVASGGASSGGSSSGGASSGGSGAGGAGPACSGKPGALTGKSSQSIMVGSVARTFVYYVPSGLPADTPAPIVIVPHGFTMSGEAMYDITEYSKIADREKFIAIFPDGEPASLGPWNVGTGVCGAGAFVGAAGDDQSFVNAMIDFAEKDRCVDRDHVFMTGFSMGGYFSHESACQNPNIRAAGPHSGGTHDLSTCKNTGHKPMIIFHFKSDSLISYTCATDARDKWVAKNGCSAANPTVTTVKGGTCEYYKNCPADGQVALCSFDEPAGGGGETPTGHAWSGGSKAGPLGAASAISSTESASELGWAFFKKYAW